MKIKEIGRVVTGKTPNTKDKENFDGLIKFITPEDIAKGYIIKTTNRHISEKGYESIESNTLNGISILVGCIGSDMGNVAISEGKCASNQQINAITDIIDSWNPFYIYYYLSMKKQYFRQLAGTTTTPILPKSIFEEIEIPDMGRKQQDKIVDVLKGLDDKINNNNEIIVELESMAKTIYDYWFLQFEFPNEDGKPYKASGGKMVWNEELRREIPEGWEVKGVEDFGTLSNGINYNKNEIGDKRYKIVNVRNMSNTSLLLDKADMDNINLKAKVAENYLLKQEDILIARSGIPGAIRILEGDIENTIYCGFIIRLNLKSHQYRKYLVYKLKDYENTTATTSGGTILQNVSQSILRDIRFAIPTEKYISAFNEKIDSIWLAMKSKTEENRELISLRGFLLPLLMNGQVGFKD